MSSLQRTMKRKILMRGKNKTQRALEGLLAPKHRNGKLKGLRTSKEE